MSFLNLHGEWPGMNNKTFGQRVAGMNSKIFNNKLSWLIGKMYFCGQVDKRVDKRVDNRSRGRSSSSRSGE